MSIEKKLIKLINNFKDTFFEELYIYEEASNNKDLVQLDVNINGNVVSVQEEYYFPALQLLRTELERINIQLVCNGSAKIVFPSPLQMSMGGTKAYKLYMGQQARNSDVVDIFDYDEELVLASVKAQSEYYNEWLKSL